MRTQGLVAVLLLGMLSACVHNDTVTLGLSRKIVDADAPEVTKGAYGLTLIGEFALSPITGVVDAVRNPPREDGEPLLFSFILTRTLARADMNIWHHCVALPLPLLVDLAVYPVFAIVDGVIILVNS